MSSLFNDVMRAMVYCNASGFGPETPEQAESRARYEAERAASCPGELDLDEDAIYCGLKRGHRGMFHIQTIGGQEVRWRKKD